MVNQFSVVILVVAAFVSNVLAYPTYVPEGACKSMLPGHGEAPQNSPAPYLVEVDPKIIKQGDVVQVVLSGKDGKTFKGFYLQARTPDGTPVGTFIRNSVTKTHNCPGGVENAAFHGVRGDKKDVTIFWTAPTDYQGEINFYATFVAEFDKIWTYVRGDNPVTVKV